ncbi:alpha/beta fold hydrolase [Nocardia brevicatena]|uniref:alpha/beta fold hydrolase n=1 Tax=Nocardia brevicatena TaxID=37327 RepID=UPI0002E876D7|nr:alpha/beta hydrolase [Nocardia brevicatena]
MSNTSAPAPVKALHLGSGAPLLLLHGLMLSPHCWEQTAERLAARCEVFAPALAGHWGGPDLPIGRIDVRALTDRVETQLDELGWRTCHIVGSSLGGWIGFELARRGRARTLTAIAPLGGWTAPSPAQLRAVAEFASLDLVTRICRHLGSFPTNSRIMRRATAFLLAKDTRAVSHGDIEAQITAALNCPAVAPLVVEFLRGARLTDLADITTPVRLLFADTDRILPRHTYAPRFLRELPDSTDRILIAGVGHVPMLEAPDRIAGLIAEHIYASRDHLRAV